MLAIYILSFAGYFSTSGDVSVKVQAITDMYADVQCNKAA